VPKILGFRAWFESRFGDLCALHDLAYIHRAGWRIVVDYTFAKNMWLAGYWWLAIPSFILICAVGWVWWWDVPQRLGFKKNN
jgi:hypothetical protein